MADYLYDPVNLWLLRRADGVYIPVNDTENPDFIAFQAWLDLGNTYDTVIPDETDLTFSEDPWW